MKAATILNVKINDANGEWRIVTGANPVVYNLAFQRCCEALNLQDTVGATRSVGFPSLAIGALLVGHEPVVVAAGGVGNVFGEPDHPYAWEQKRSGARGRRNQFNLAYCFPEGTTELPSVSDIRARAKQDARRLIEAAYQAVERTGRSEIPQEIAEFESGATHTGEWAKVAKALRQGRAFEPFIDTGSEIRYLDVGISEVPDPTSAPKGEPPKTPNSSSYTFLKSALWSNSAARCRSRSSSFLEALKILIRSISLVSVLLTR